MSVFRHPHATPGRNYNDVSMRIPKPPERPLQPYMRYSRKMWPKVRAENPDAPLWDIGKIIGKMWQETTDAERSIYQHEFEMERIEYEKQMKNFQNAGYSGFGSAKGRAKNNEKMSRSRMDAGGVVIQPVDEDDGVNELSTRRLAGIRFERNNRLISELFSPSIVTDTRSIVPTHRMDMLKRQAASLSAHQNKLEEELVRLQSTHNERKRVIEKGSDDFQESLKKEIVVNEKPVVDEEKFEETVKEWEKKLAEAYVDYKKQQDEINAKLTVTASTAPVLSKLVMDENSKENGENEEKEKSEEPEVKKEGENPEQSDENEGKPENENEEKNSEEGEAGSKKNEEENKMEDEEKKS